MYKEHPLQDNSTEKIIVSAPVGLTRQLLAGYLSRMRGSIPNLSAAVTRREFEVAGVFGHRLKGTGGAYGIPKLTEIGSAIERAAENESLNELQALVVMLEAYLCRLEAV